LALATLMAQVDRRVAWPGLYEEQDFISHLQ